MAELAAVVFLVRCTSDLLLCQDVDTARLQFADIEQCRDQLPGVVRQLKRDSSVLMGSCRLALDRSPVRSPVIAESPGGSRRSLSMLQQPPRERR
jgi:hypothetical protein